MISIFRLRTEIRKRIKWKHEEEEESNSFTVMTKLRAGWPGFDSRQC